MSKPDLDNLEETESHAIPSSAPALGAENGPDGGNCFAFSPTLLTTYLIRNRWKLSALWADFTDSNLGYELI